MYFTSDTRASFTSDAQVYFTSDPLMLIMSETTGSCVKTPPLITALW